MTDHRAAARAAVFTLAAFAAVLVYLAGCGEDPAQPPEQELRAPGVWTGGDWVEPSGADPDGVGLDGDPDDVIERVTLPTGELVDPGDFLPDLTEVEVLYTSGRVEKTTWGRIKEEYGGSG